MANPVNIIGLLGKVKFIFYSNPDIPGIGIPYQPVYNPTEFSVSYNNTYDEGQQANSGDSTKKFVSFSPRTLSMELFFDGTGASPSNSLINSIGINTVDLQIKAFLALAFTLDKEKHEPHFVTVVWGSFILNGVFTTADVSYTMFEPDGRPLRATIKIEIEETIATSLLGKLLGLLSPDLSKSIVVKEGDTLPLLCHQEYNDASLYPKIAEVNNLKNYRKLKQGMELLFPPIDNLA
ncbi:MAG: peptidoglycan-binding protein [Bacteroidetes bacterium]|nr:peptidoglycan-binding protein [Bacteroidota bacterium]